MVAELDNTLSLEDPRDRKAYYFTTTPFRRVVTPLVLGALRLYTDVTISGTEHVPAHGPVVLAANHLTNYDVFFIQMAINPRPIFYMGKEELFRNPLMDYALRQLGGFPVYRGAGDDWAMRHAEQVLQHGLVLGIFPEGTRSKGKGLKSAKTGAARLALDEGCSILPVAVDGPQHLFKKANQRVRVQVTVGEVIHPHHGESALALTDRMMFALADLLPPDQRGVYSFRPKGF